MNNELIAIGDVHCKISAYLEIIKKHDGDSIQVGDFGFDIEHEWHLKNVNSTKHKVNFGNHEDYRFLNKPHSLGNFSYIPKYELLSVRGALSIDQHKRIEGVDWFRNEELEYNELNLAIDHCELKKPKIIISHDCPHEVRKHLFDIHEKSTTSNGLQGMFEVHQPDIWIFGHFHRSKDEVINGTRFICLAELEVFKF